MSGTVEYSAICRRFYFYLRSHHFDLKIVYCIKLQLLCFPGTTRVGCATHLCILPLLYAWFPRGLYTKCWKYDIHKCTTRSPGFQFTYYQKNLYVTYCPITIYLILLYFFDQHHKYSLWIVTEKNVPYKKERTPFLSLSV